MNDWQVNLFDFEIEINPEADFDKISIITPSCKGVILFADGQDNPVQLLTAANIRQTVRAKIFTQDQSNSPKTNLSQIVRKAYVKKCYNDFAAGWNYYMIAKKIYPDDYKKLIKLGKPSYLKFQYNGNFPALNICDIPYQESGKLYGVFMNRKSAQLYKDLITDTFGLCRNQSCIDKPSRAKSCPYYQMNRCDAPCLGHISKDEYQQRFEQAENAINKYEDLIELINQKMKALSLETKFEQAQNLKVLLQQLIQKKSHYNWINRLSDLGIVHIDIGEKVKEPDTKKAVQFYNAYLIRCGFIIGLGRFAQQDTGSLVNKIGIEMTKPLPLVGKNELSEILSLVSFYLYRSNRRGIWLEIKDISSDNIGRRISDFGLKV